MALLYGTCNTAEHYITQSRAMYILIVTPWTPWLSIHVYLILCMCLDPCEQLAVVMLDMQYCSVHLSQGFCIIVFHTSLVFHPHHPYFSF